MRTDTDETDFIEIKSPTEDTPGMAKKKKKTASQRTQYDPIVKGRIITRLLGEKESVAEISADVGVNESLLYGWKNKALGALRKEKVTKAVSGPPKRRSTNGSNGVELTIQAAVPAVQAAASIQEATTKFLGSTVITSSMVRELAQTVREALIAIEVP